MVSPFIAREGGALRRYIAAVRSKSRFQDVLRFLRESQWRPPKWHEEYQEKGLRKLIEFAAENVPFYRSLVKNNRIGHMQVVSIDDLREFPIITETDLRDGFDKFISDLARNEDFATMALSRKYSDTFYIPLDDSTLIAGKALVSRHYENAGYRFGSPVICFVHTIEGYEYDKFRIDKANRRYYFAASRLNRKNLAEYCSRIKDLKAGFVFGYPGALEVFADYVLEWEINLKFQGVVTSGELLSDMARYKIEKALNAKVYDLYQYSLPILGMGQCHYCDGYHLFSEFCILELMDFYGNPVKEEGKVGRMVVTNISNRSLPIIRFDTGDLGIYDGTKCECGRGMPKIVRKISGSQKELLIGTDGRFLTAGALQAVFGDAGFPAAEYQMIQKSGNKFRLKLVRGPEYETENLEIIKSSLREKLGSDSDITVEPVNSIKGDGKKPGSIIREYDPRQAGKFGS